MKDVLKQQKTHSKSFLNAVPMLVKFQTFNVDRFVSSEEKKRTKILRKFKFSYEQFADLSHFSEKI